MPANLPRASFVRYVERHLPGASFFFYISWVTYTFVSVDLPICPEHHLLDKLGDR